MRLIRRDVGIIARKVSSGNKTEAGKGAWERLASLAAARHQRGVDFTSWLAAVLPINAPAPAIPTPAPTRQTPCQAPALQVKPASGITRSAGGG